MNTTKRENGGHWMNHSIARKMLNGFLFMLYAMCFLAFWSSMEVQAQSETTKRIDGLKFEKEFDSNGPGNRAKFEVPTSVLAKKTTIPVSGGNRVQLSFNTRHTWAGPPVYLRQIDETDTFAFPYMVAGMTKDRSYVELMIPFGPGTVFEVYGKVQVFGLKIEASKQDPLVFVIFSPSGREDTGMTTKPVGSQSWPDQPFPSGPFPDPVFWPDSAETTQSSSQINKQFFLVHVAGSGFVTRSTGNRIELKDK